MENYAHFASQGHAFDKVGIKINAITLIKYVIKIVFDTTVLVASTKSKGLFQGQRTIRPNSNRLRTADTTPILQTSDLI